MDLFIRFMMSTTECGCDQIYIYPDMTVDVNRFNTSEAIIQHYNESEFLFLIVSHDPEPLINIDVNTSYLAMEEFISIIKQVAEKHSFKLDIEDD